MISIIIPFDILTELEMGNPSDHLKFVPMALAQFLFFLNAKIFKKSFSQFEILSEGK
jgi:hypothetical protein